MIITSGRTTRQPFVADRDSLVRTTGHSIDWANVGEEYRSTPGQVVTVAGAALAGATALPVAALTAAIPSGTTIVFDAAAGEYATLTAAAAAGDTVLTVQPLAQAFEGGETGTVAGTGNKFIPAGTRMGTAASGNGTLRPAGAGNPAVGILETDANEGELVDARSGYSLLKGGHLYENLLPGATGSPRAIPAGERAELLTAGVTTFVFSQYVDSSAP